MEPPILEFKNITKAFPGVLALDDVSLSFQPGEVHAIVGENGAGKSTLIKTCSGVNKPDKGEIVFEGHSFSELTHIQSIELGIGVIYQEFSLVPQLTVAENVFLGNYLTRGMVLDDKSMEATVKELFAQLQVNIDPKALVSTLSVGYQQMVELVRVLLRKAKLIIMDEPTGTLSINETEKLFQVIAQLKAGGVTIVYISHRLDEIFKLSDRVSVFRDGMLIATKNTAETNREELIRMMVGRTLSEVFPERNHTGEEIILEAKNLTGNGVEDISIKVKKGKILGLGGLVGAGRTEFAQLLCGYRKIDSGEICFKGEKIFIKDTRQALDYGIFMVPEDRKEQGLVLDMTVKENISLTILRKISTGMVVDQKEEDRLTEQYKDALAIKTFDMSKQFVKNLSGGNQQKVVVAKGMAIEPELIIFDEPTRGIDVGAKQEIYALLDDLAKRGKAIIMISSDMEELLGMSDEIYIMCEGRVTGHLDRRDFCQETVLQYASNVRI